ncbi:MAG: hypothetical protein AAGD07_08690 [Planctomycetota bacterium]
MPSPRVDTNDPALRVIAITNVIVSWMGLSMAHVHANDRPDQILFRRQAVQRMVFDQDQAIRLASFSPAKVVALDLMHPDLVPMEHRANSLIQSDKLVIAAPGNHASRSVRWVGGFNVFATYDVEIGELLGSGTVGIQFRDSDSNDSLTADVLFQDGMAHGIRWRTTVDGVKNAEYSWPLAEDPTTNESFILRVQMVAVGANVFLESRGRSSLIGYVDLPEQVELRDKRRMARYQFAMAASLEPKARATISGATAAITPGTGQADIRAMTDEFGNPLLDDSRLWFTVTTRGRALPHPAQGVFSLNPSVFDLRFEGLIVFDAGDGLLRNELASHLFRDSQTGQWRGWTTGFSALGNQKRGDSKAILAVWSDRDPRRGFSIMRSRAIGIEGAHEDPHCVYDADAQKWRLLLCERAGKYQAAMWESDEWDRGYARLAGPVEVDSTGTLIQTFGDQRYVLFGSADRRVYIRNYPDLTAAGELRIELPPWNDQHGTRIWPNVIPLPDGYPAPYIALMMDRANFPGMPTRNWTYGALYLYHGTVSDEE